MVAEDVSGLRLLLPCIVVRFYCPRALNYIGIAPAETLYVAILMLSKISELLPNGNGCDTSESAFDVEGRLP